MNIVSGNTSKYADTHCCCREGHPFVSVIIPVLNEERVLGQCLESLKGMNFSSGELEVIIVDNGSTDKTIQIAHNYGTIFRLTVTEKKGVHISALRNLGAAQARGDIFVFLDADCLVPTEWLSFALNCFNAQDVGVLGGYYRIPEGSSWVARTWYPEEEVNKRGIVPYLPSGDLMVTRAAFSLVGGFDETLETNEDYEFCQRIRAAGLGVVAYPELNVIHLGVPQTLGHFYRRNRWHGKHVMRVFLRDISSLHNAKPVFFALYVLVCLVGVFVGLGLGALGRFEVLAASLVALLVGPFLLGLRAAIARKRWTEVIPLASLYLVFGFSRAQCLVDFRNWSD
jgi:glycosyltransferase involved in cell wall biosynthesis